MHRKIIARWTWIVGLMATLGLLTLTATQDAGGQDPKELKPYVEKIAGTGVSFEMMPIPGGTFLLGSPESEEDRNEDEGPQVEVTIRPFWMWKHEVTWDEFEIFAFGRDMLPEGQANANRAATDKAADAVTRPTPPYTDMTFGYGKDKYPAICMCHHAAMEYCHWLSAKTGKNYRLPTEAEWEYACRAGTKTRFSFGDDAAKIGEYAWYTENSDSKPHPVGQKKPNPWGLFDMHGNVTEWCLDHHDEKFFSTLKTGKPVIGPINPPTERRYPHVVRGGSWDEEPAALRSAARRGSNREWLRQDPQRPQSIWWLTEGVFVGFRVVCPVEEQENLKGIRSKITKQSK